MLAQNPENGDCTKQTSIELFRGKDPLSACSVLPLPKRDESHSSSPLSSAISVGHMYPCLCAQIIGYALGLSLIDALLVQRRGVWDWMAVRLFGSSGGSSSSGDSSIFPSNTSQQ